MGRPTAVLRPPLLTGVAAISASALPDWLKRPRDLAVRLNRSPYRMVYMFVASFMETILVPLAIEIVMVPFMLANRDRIWTIAHVTLAGCLAAAAIGYGVGWLAFETLGRWLIETFGFAGAFRAFQEDFNRNGFWAILLIGASPLPFPVAMLAAGSAGYPFLLYMVACTLARCFRYYGLAVLVLLFGPAVLRVLHNRRWMQGLTAGAALLALVLLVALWLW